MKSSTRQVYIHMVVFTVLVGLASLMLFAIFRWRHYAFLRLFAIILLLAFYHFAVRLAAGEAITYIFRDNSFPQDGMGFRIYGFEHALYRKLGVKSWKTRVITAKPEQFDLNLVTPAELLHNVMQAELVHRVNMLLSFAPLFLIIPFGLPWLFIITSTAACLLDGVFVIIQRYNRPRVLRYMALADRKNGSD